MFKSVRRALAASVIIASTVLSAGVAVTAAAVHRKAPKVQVAFAFFGCVPVELWWDNPKTVAIHLYQGRDRTLHSRYAALASHYPFTPKFCLPATPTEKPRVENRVFDLQRQ